MNAYDLEKFVDEQRSKGESWPAVKARRDDMLFVCSYCQWFASDDPDKLEEIKKNNAKISNMAYANGVGSTHGVCEECIPKNEENNKRQWKELNELSNEEKNATVKKWELSKMAADDFNGISEDSLYRESNSEIEDEIAKWIGELEYYLDKNMPMNIIGELIETPEEYFEDHLSEYINQNRGNPGAGAYDFLNNYLNRISKAVIDIEQNPYGAGEEDERSSLKRKDFDNSIHDNHAIELLKEFEQTIEEFVNDLPDETKNTYDFREQDSWDEEGWSGGDSYDPEQSI